MRINLKITHKGTAAEHPLLAGQMITIGRSSKCECQVGDEKISSRHCRLFLRSDRLEVTDLDSKNGTYLNGIRIELSEVFVGDEIRLGETLISFEDSRCDLEALELLTFPGPHRDRMAYELKMDFTGARIKNQEANKRLSVMPKVDCAASHAKEVALRRRIKSNIRLSKQEIRERHRLNSFIATSLDALLMIGLVLLPFLLGARYLPEYLSKTDKIGAIFFAEVMLIFAYIYLNFRLPRFTFGEKISGIDKIYFSQ